MERGNSRDAASVTAQDAHLRESSWAELAGQDTLGLLSGGPKPVKVVMQRPGLNSLDLINKGCSAGRLNSTFDVR